jgi:hypothetical protein
MTEENEDQEHDWTNHTKKKIVASAFTRDVRIIRVIRGPAQG